MRRTVPPSSADGLARRLQRMEQEIADLQSVRGTPPSYVEPEDGGGGGPFVVVAASDAPARWADLADYTCDGTADEVEINAAFTAHPNTAVLLSPGTFTIADTIFMPQDSRTQGAPGETTKINVPDSVTAIWMSNHAIATDLYLQASGTTVGTVGIDLAAQTGAVVERCVIEYMTKCIELSQSVDAVVRDCTLTAWGASSWGIDDDASDRALIDNCRFVSSGSDNGGLRLVGRQARVRHCYFVNLPNYGILATKIGTPAATQFVIDGCIFDNVSTSEQLSIVDSSKGAVSNCQFLDAGPVTVDDGSSAILMHGNMFGAALDIAIDGDRCSLTSNYLITGATITTGATADRTAIGGNYVADGAAALTDGGTNTQRPTNGNFSDGGLW